MKKILVFCAFFLLRIEGHTQSLTYPWQAGQTVSASGLNAAFSNRATFSVSPLTKYSVLLGNGAGDIMPMGSLGLNGQILTSTGPGFAPTWADLPVNSNPMTAIGDMIIGASIGNPARLPIGTSNQVLTVIGGVPSWSSSGSFTTLSASGVITSTITTGTSPFVVASTTNVANLNAASVNGATFSSPGSIGTGTPGSGSFTTLSASSTVSGNGFDTYLSSPPAIGGLTPSAGTFSTLTATGKTVFSNGTSATPSSVFTGAATTGLYWANPGIGFSVSGTSIGSILSTGLNSMAIGATTPSTASFTTVAASDVITSTISTGTAPFVVASTTPVANLSIGGNAATATTATSLSGGSVAATTISASSTVSGSGFSTYLASPPAIGGSAPAAGAFTTLSASSTVSGAGFSTYLASPPAIGGSSAAAGSFTTLSASSTVSGTGFSTYLASPPSIGGTTAAAGKFTTLQATSAITPTYPAGIIGSASGSAVTAGSLGEIITATGTAVSISTGSSTQITTVSLTAGIWQLVADISWTPAASTTISAFFAGINSATPAQPAQPFSQFVPLAVGAGVASNINFGSPPIQTINISSPTSYYCNAGAVFAVSTMTATCTLTAYRR